MQVGGAKALATIAEAAKSSNPLLQDTGSRLLGKWNGVEAALVFRCLRVEASETVLLAWRLIDVHTPDQDDRSVPPWWTREAWRGLWRDDADLPADG